MLQKSARQGIALVTGLIFLMVTAVLVSIALLVSTSNSRLSGDSLRSYQAQLAAEAGLQRVIAESWFTAYEASEDENVPDNFQITLEAFRKQLDEAGIAAGADERGAYSFGEAVFYTEDLEGASYSAAVRRVDVGESYTLLRADVTGLTGSEASPVATRRLSADLRVQVPQADSAGFAVLGDNANCLFCHTQISSLETAYDQNGKLLELATLTTPQQRKTALQDKQRVKMAVLENLVTDRPSDMQSVITGTIYTRGESNVTVQGSTLSGIPFRVIDKQSTSLLGGDAPKILTEQDAVNCAGSCSKRHALFYKNYPANGADGDVPKTFPQLIPDTNHNRLVEHSEWQDTVQGSQGVLKGGSKKMMATENTGQQGLSLAGTTLREVATLSSSDSTNGVPGHVVLQGTATNPLVLDGDVFINGDVVLRGAVTGNGRLIARGNVYLVGSVTYACDDDAGDERWQASQHKTCAYNKPDTLPRLGVVAGKNMLVGSYMTPATSAKGRPADQLTRLNFSKTSATELATYFVDAGVPLETPQRLSYTLVQMTLFNEHEYRKATADSSYIPRFYRLREDGPVYRCSRGFSQSKEDYCKTYGELTSLSESTNAADLAVLDRAAVISATLTGSWLGPSAQASELAVREAWVNQVETGQDGPLQLDGLYYTANSIFGNLPLSSKTKGEVIINGSLAASDLALLAQGSLSVNSDERLADMLETTPTSFVTQTLSNYRLLDVDAELDYGNVRE
jgi:hypothetical protein